MVYIPRALFSSDGHNIMTHVRRLDLQDVIAETLINLVSAILVAGTIPLTHLAISTTVSRIERAVALVLVDSLRNAPNLAVLLMFLLGPASPSKYTPPLKSYIWLARWPTLTVVFRDRSSVPHAFSFRLTSSSFSFLLTGEGPSMSPCVRKASVYWSSTDSEMSAWNALLSC